MSLNQANEGSDELIDNIPQTDWKIIQECLGTLEEITMLKDLRSKNTMLDVGQGPQKVIYYLASQEKILDPLAFLD